MKKFSILLIVLGVSSLLCGKDLNKVKDLYTKHYEKSLSNGDLLRAHLMLNKMQRRSEGEDFSKQKMSLQDSIFAKAIYYQKNFNADKAARYLNFYVSKFSKKKAQAYRILADIYAQAGEQDEVDLFVRKAKELQE